MNKKVGLSPEGHLLANNFRVPRDANSNSGLNEELIGQLIQLGVLSTLSDTTQPIDLHRNFQGWKSQRGMLLDTRRTRAFRDAIEQTIRGGETVIDVGSGSGILSMFAARAGAKEVFALEITSAIELSRLIAQRNGLHAIEFIQGDAGNFEADSKVDLIISEFIGMYVLDEWLHFSAFAKVRDANLKEDGKVIPKSAQMYLSAIDNHRLYVERGQGFWETPVFGFDFSDVLAVETTRPQREIVYQFEEKSIVDTASVASFDFKTSKVDDYFFEKELEFTYAAAGFCHGFLGHFDLEVVEGKCISTSPLESSTNWRQSYFPMPKIAVEAGEKINLVFRTFKNSESGEFCIGLQLKNRRAEEQPPELVYVLDSAS
ncbi:50S ribosomal protein L11 methyltransferase [Variovorax sp. OV700]|uniref:50S ribosomal protein L11 methyltransferase n=1 Tax=Variovorax sp. OV700 TaxID=1882826 RepID=UPI00087FC509|nr:50S ribosomal protein L11 methyltransferase [Variovorax sp. OV700]SDI23403.1 protein arginine N-methyltransferase 1 [Variovorax sp. OV700]